MENNTEEKYSQQSKCRWSTRPQFTEIAIASLLHLSAGMNLALSVGWLQYSLFGPMQHFCYSWFIGGIIGALISVPLSLKLSYKFLKGISCILIFISAITFASGPTLNNILLAGRYLNGIAVGLNTVPFIMYATDVTDDSRRGSYLALEQGFLTCGFAIQMLYTSYWSIDKQFNLPANRLHGFLDFIVCGVAWAVLRWYKETPMTAILKNNNAAALESIAKLHRPYGITEETEKMLLQRQTYIEEQQTLSLKQCITRSLFPLFKIILFRSVILALSNSLNLNLAFHHSMAVSPVNWVPVMAALFRIAGSVITLLMADTIERKLFSVIYGICIGSLCLSNSGYFNSNPETAKYFYMGIQFFVGLYAPYTTIYMTEAFPFKVKRIMMTICVIVEQILQIILICSATMMQSKYSLYIEAGILLCVILVLPFTMPETKKTSLAEALERFKKPFYSKLR